VKELLARLRGKVFQLKCRLAKNEIRIGNGLRIYKRLILHGNGTLIIGENCTIGGIKGDREQYVSLDTLNRDARIEIGRNVKLYAVRLSCRYSIKIGDNVHIEETGIMDTDFHSIERERSEPLNENKANCEIKIGNNVKIGARSIVAKGVKIGDAAVIGPGSVVIRSIPSSSLALGNPAKVVER
jgi:acetyltransferase-like isoleucine patch superfamily enzyme